jgi:hypothetical protein
VSGVFIRELKGAYVSGVSIAASLILGCVASLLALKTRAALIAPLGSNYVRRFAIIQAGVINALLFVTIYQLSQYQGWGGANLNWVMPGLYGCLFYAYSVSNVDWTIAKFHAEEH